MITIKEIKDQWRLMCDDTIPDAIDAHLEAVGHMYERDLPIPSYYRYIPGKGDVTEPDSPCHYLLKDASEEVVEEFAELMFRYIRRYIMLIYDCLDTADAIRLSDCGDDIDPKALKVYVHQEKGWWIEQSKSGQFHTIANSYEHVGTFEECHQLLVRELTSF